MVRSAVDANVRAEQLRVIYKQAVPASLISLLISIVVCLILRDVTDRGYLAAWFGALTAIAIFRFVLVRRFHRQKPGVEDIDRWERYFVASLIGIGIVWGIGGVLIMPRDSVLYQAVVYFFLMGMAGGAVASYSAHAACTYVTICFVLLPSTVWFVLQDSLILRGMAVGGLVYVAAAIRATRTLSFFLRRSFQLSHELRLANEMAERLARTDELTGMKNRRAFYELAQQAFEQAERYDRPLSLISLDGAATAGNVGNCRRARQHRDSVHLQHRRVVGRRAGVDAGHADGARRCRDVPGERGRPQSCLRSRCHALIECEAKETHG